MSLPEDPNLPTGLTSTPPPVADTLVSFPETNILLVRLNRPKALNAITFSQHFALERLWEWYDDQPSLRCAVIVGTGRAFSVGADLKEWHDINDPKRHAQGHDASSRPEQRHNRTELHLPRSGFGGLSNRSGKKPVIAAVNGICFGGGMEMVINCDMVIAAASAKFALPEVTVGVVALAGCLPRLVRSVGRQRATEMALTGKPYTAEEMKVWGLVNEAVKDSEGGEAVLEKSIEWARCIARNSPDAVIVSREALKLGGEPVGPELGTDMLFKGWYGRIDKGENMVEGIKSFLEKRKPVWKDSEL